MNYTKRIVCLANSRKPSGRCVAGKEMIGAEIGSWIRPVSARPSHEISLAERRLADGSDPRLLDIVDVSFLAPVPVLHQTENHRIDRGTKWTKAGQFSVDDLPSLVDHPETLWANGDSTVNGLNDRVRADATANLTNSLVLIAPEDLVLRVSTDGAFFGNPRKRVRADFSYNGVRYILLVTDPAAEATYRIKPEGDYELANCFFCISLAEEHSDHYCYKVVAAIICR